MNSIMVGFDGTDPSYVALDWAAARAAAQQCRVDIVTVNAGDLFAPEIADAALEDAARRCRDVAVDAEVASRTVSGRMPDALLRAAATADALIIGAHHHRPVRSALSGWRPLRTASRSVKPVVVVPDDWTVSDGPVLVGIDDDGSSDQAADFAVGEARITRAGVTLLHAWQMPTPTMDGSVALLASPIEVKADHRRVLDRAKERALALDPSLAVEALLIRDNPSSALLMEARRSSLLVIGTHHRGILAGAFLGSVGQDVLVESRIPVCVVPA